MRPTLIAIVQVVALLTFSAPLAFGAEPTLEGTYTATGLNPDGSEYHAVVRIARRGESFLVAWLSPKVADDETVVSVAKKAGVGVVSGAMLAVSYYGQDLTGVILYQIEEGGKRLLGRSVTAEGDGTVRSETLIKVPTTPAPATPDTGEQPPPTPTKPTRA